MTLSDGPPPLPITQLNAATAAERFRPLLLRCLSRLASKGWVIRPDDGFDLITDFFLTQWGGIAQRYSGSKGSIEGYLATAFVYYARRRWAEMRRWSNTLRDSAQLAQVASPDPGENEFAQNDRETVGRALMVLPDASREALLAYLSASGRRERDVAAGLNITRHRLRSLVADAFGRVVVALGGVDELSSDREIALLLWRDGLSVSRVAHQLGVPAARVQEVRSAILRRLRRALM